MHKDKVKCYVSCFTKEADKKTKKWLKLSLCATNKGRLLISSYRSESKLALVMWLV